MNAEHASKSPTAKTGFFATLSILRRAEGTGAPSVRLLALLGLATATAIAALLSGAALSTTSASAAEPCPNESSRVGPSAALPECRAFEMVTPPYKEGYTTFLRAIAPDGSRVLIESLGVFAGAPAAPASRGATVLIYEISRSSEGWVTRPLTPANPQFRSAVTYAGGSADVSRTLFSMPAPPVGQDNFFLRGPGTSLTDIGPLTPPADGPTVEPGPVGGPQPGAGRLEGASADLSVLVFGVEGSWGWAGDPTPRGAFNLYEYVGSANTEPTMVAVTGGPGSTNLIGQCGNTIGSRFSRFNAVSSDGATVFFTPLSAGVEPSCSGSRPLFQEIYARIDGSETVRISERSPTDCAGPCALSAPSDSFFAGASTDGSKAFFLSTQQLTNSATQDEVAGDTAERGGGSGCQEAVGSGCNLYLYDFDRPAGKNLVAISAGSAQPHVQGLVRISPDGSTVYFVAQGKLTESPNASGETAVSGANNLYVYRLGSGEQSGAIAFIASLAPSTGEPGESISADEELWGAKSDSDIRPAQTTAHGDFLVIQSSAPLTSDISAEGAQQLFEYSASSGEVRHVSIPATGYAPAEDPDHFAATIRRLAYASETGPEAGAKAMSEDGRTIYFESSASLVPSARSGSTNIYVSHDGETALIFGTSGKETEFRGTSNSGQDAFFKTSEALVPADTDRIADVYDARVNGARTEPLTPPQCEGDACQIATRLPGDIGSAGSGSFTGPPNPGPSRRRHCVRKKKGHRKTCTRSNPHHNHNRNHRSPK